MHIAMQQRIINQQLREIRLGKRHGRRDQSKAKQKNKILSVRTQESERSAILIKQRAGKEYS
jgi:hypothetical protein